MKKLNDRVIRKSLITKLNNRSKKPNAIIEELRVHNGNAIADVVALYKDAHCYEIKSDLDKIERAIAQGSFYNPSFRKISLVTTKKHIKKALDIAPPFWGILLAEPTKKEVKISTIRKATLNSNFSKNLALLTLWKAEMLNLIPHDTNKYKRINRDTLTKIISSNLKKTEVSQEISNALAKRSSDLN